MFQQQDFVDMNDGTCFLLINQSWYMKVHYQESGCNPPLRTSNSLFFFFYCVEPTHLCVGDATAATLKSQKGNIVFISGSALYIVHQMKAAMPNSLLVLWPDPSLLQQFVIYLAVNFHLIVFWFLLTLDLLALGAKCYHWLRTPFEAGAFEDGALAADIL